MARGLLRSFPAMSEHGEITHKGGTMADSLARWIPGARPATEQRALPACDAVADEGPRLRVGDVVIWRGAWGQAAPALARVVAIEATERRGEKYGRTVGAVAWTRPFVVTLDNRRWAYSYQLEPVKGGAR